MAVTPPGKGERQIGWNGLQIRLPADWEAIVAAPRHLLFEKNLRPLIEIRWDDSGRSSVDSVITAASRQLAATDSAVHRSPPSPPYNSLNFPHLTALAWNDDRLPEGLVWQCDHCVTVFFCHLLQSDQTDHPAIVSLLQSLSCHREAEQPNLWSLQDFQLIVPPGYTFIDSTFAAGLSRLAFSGADLELQFCRLAPASTRLVNSSLAQLLRTMLDNPETAEILATTPELHEQRNMPSTSSRFLARFRKKPLFHWGRIWHDTAHNRLLSVIAHSRRPIDLPTVHHLSSQYEILPLPTAR